MLDTYEKNLGFNLFMLRTQIDRCRLDLLYIENNFGIYIELTNFLKESCRFGCDLHVSFKYFPKEAFVQKILPKQSGCFGCYRHEPQTRDIFEG